MGRRSAVAAAVAVVVVVIVIVGAIVVFDQLNASPTASITGRDHAERATCTESLVGAAELDATDPETAERVHLAILAAPVVAQDLRLFEQTTVESVWGDVLSVRAGAGSAHVQPLCVRTSASPDDQVPMLLHRVVVYGDGVIGYADGFSEALDQYVTAAGD